MQLIWAIEKMEPLIPDGKDWDTKAQSIANIKNEGKEALRKIAADRFPYECTVLDTEEKFLPTRIDYENRQVWRQIGQASDSGQWYDYDEIELEWNPFFLLKPLHKR